MDYQKLKRMSAQDIKDLIEDVPLHNKDFDSDEVDHRDNMHERLMRAVADGEMDPPRANRCHV